MLNSAFENYFNVFNKLAGENKILWKVHYDTCIDKNGTYILRLNYRALMPKLMDCYYKATVDHRLENSHLDYDDESLPEAFKSYKDYFNPQWMMEAASFRKELGRKKYCLSSSYPVMFESEKDYGVKYVSRSGIIDIHKLMETGVSIEKLLSDNRKRHI